MKTTIVKPSEPRRDSTIRKGFRVIGPNTADGRQSTWYFDGLEEAKHFATNIANQMDADYDILQYVGTIRQTPVHARPIEFVEPGD